MKRTRRPRTATSPEFTTESVGLDPALYAEALQCLFDRPEPNEQQQDWFWPDEAPENFTPSPLEWTRIQTILFANAGAHLAPYSNEQVGMGLGYVMGSPASDIPFAVCAFSVPEAEGLAMLKAMPRLWRDCFGPRLATVHAPIGSDKGGRLGYACYMWFDVWPTLWNMRHRQSWRDAAWHVLEELLAMPFREVQISALHGIGHWVNELDRDDDINRSITAFVKRLGNSDNELLQYAEAARSGRVQ